MEERNMKTTLPTFTSLGTLGLLLMFHGSLAAESVRTQTIAIEAGWNAVYLEVDPLDNEPELVFGGTPFEIVARRFTASSTVQFISDPEEVSWNEPGWGAWYAPERPDHFLSSLHAIHGKHAYLILSRDAFAWQITGRVLLRKYRWQAHSFNLTGFSVNADAPPSFDAFFAGANGLIGQRIFRLVDGTWNRVASGTARMRSGEAYWIYCEGQTSYQGPLDWEVPGVWGLDFGDRTGELDVSFSNRSGIPAQIDIEWLSGALPLFRAQRSPETLLKIVSPLPAVLSFPNVAAGDSRSLRLQVRREWMGAAVQSSLLRVTSDTGFQVWVPVQAGDRRPAGGQ
jgi:hypothetical protein